MNFITETKIGKLNIEYEDKYLTKIEIYNGNDFMQLSNDFEKYVSDEINNYLDGNSCKLNIDFKIYATVFQKNVYYELLKIPYGKTTTYKELAIKINNPKSYRAVGNALNKNPLPIIIPCHRVLSTNGAGGFRYGLDIKKILLDLENKNIEKFKK